MANSGLKTYLVRAPEDYHPAKRVGVFLALFDSFFVFSPKKHVTFSFFAYYIYRKSSNFAKRIENYG